MGKNGSFELVPYLCSLYNLRRNQWQGSHELQRQQEDRLRAIVTHAYEKVDYYRKLFDHSGIKPEDIQTTQDLVKIPITNRKNLQALPHKEIVTRGVDLSRCVNLRTSGSSGMPLDIFIDSREKMLSWLFYRRVYFENGGTLSDRQLRITIPQYFRAERWFQYLGILQEKYISVFNDIESQLSVILEFKPSIIGGYASSLKNLASKVKNEKIKGINPRIIFSVAESMSERDREFIASVFKSEIIDYYACNECGIIAWECKEHSGYHIDSENVIVEFIKKDGTQARTGEEGEIVITSLNAYTMPFIRYKLGDIAIPSGRQCPCGRTLPLIEKIIGRSSDSFILPNGIKIHPFSLTCKIENIQGISQYQVIQQKRDKVRIYIVKNDSYSCKTSFDLAENCKHVLGDNVVIEIIIVDEIPDSRIGGKFQAIKSEL